MLEIQAKPVMDARRKQNFEQEAHRVQMQMLDTVIDNSEVVKGRLDMVPDNRMVELSSEAASSRAMVVESSMAKLNSSAAASSRAMITHNNTATGKGSHGTSTMTRMEPLQRVSGKVGVTAGATQESTTLAALGGSTANKDIDHDHTTRATNNNHKPLTTNTEHGNTNDNEPTPIDSRHNNHNPLAKHTIRTDHLPLDHLPLGHHTTQAEQHKKTRSRARNTTHA